MSSPIQTAIKQICDEKGIKEEAVIDTINHALAAAYRKDFAQKTQNIKVEFNPSTGELRVFDVKMVMDPPPPEVEAPETEASEDSEIAEKEVHIAPLPDENSIRWNPKLHVSLDDARDI